jgi:hypothetical protein
MKIALCLYGQPRKFYNNWHFFASNIINGSDVDVFFHCWYDPNNRNINKLTPGYESYNLDENLLSSLPELIKPKRYIIEKQKKFSDKYVEVTDENIDECWGYSKIYNKETFIKDRVKSHYSMWYSINQCLLMKELYSQENDFEYDCVIVSRFDVSPKTKINIGELDLNKLISGYNPLPRGEVNDWFFITNNKNSNIISSLFYNIDFYRDKIVSNKGVWTNEAYFRDHLKNYNIDVDYKNFNISFS